MDEMAVSTLTQALARVHTDTWWHVYKTTKTINLNDKLGPHHDLEKPLNMVADIPVHILHHIA